MFGNVAYVHVSQRVESIHATETAFSLCFNNYQHFLKHFYTEKRVPRFSTKIQRTPKDVKKTM